MMRGCILPAISCALTYAAFLYAACWYVGVLPEWLQ